MSVITGQSCKQRQGGLASYFHGYLRTLIDSDGKALQISYLGRALPEGNQGVALKALRQHRVDMTTHFESTPALLARAEAFALGWADRFLHSQLLAAPPTMSVGSNLSFNRKDGGHSAYVAGVAGEVEELRRTVEWKRRAESIANFKGLTDCHRDGAVRDSFIRDLMLKSFQDERPSGVPRGSAIVIAERGWKARIVTKSHSSLIALAHTLRLWLLEGLKKDPRISLVLEGDHERAVEKVVGKLPRLMNNRKLLSSDLSRASDLIPHDLVKAIYKGIKKSTSGKANLTDQMETVFLACIGPQELCWPDLDKTSTSITSQGIMMGLPTTWPLLCLVQLFWAEDAWNRAIWSEVPGTKWSPGDPRSTPGTAICGDDLLGHWPERVIACYNNNVTSSGGILSPGKHVKSAKYAIFTEEVYRLLEHSHTVKPHLSSWERFFQKMIPARGKNRRRCISSLGKGDLLSTSSHARNKPTGKKLKWRKLEWATFAQVGPTVAGITRVPTIPLRGLVRPKSLPNERNAIPWWAALGPAAQSISISTRNPKAVRRVLRVLWPSAWRWARERGFAVTLPRELGGFGLPCLRGRPDVVGSLPSVFGWGVSGLLYASKCGVRPPNAAWSILSRPMWRSMARESADWKFGKRGVLCKTGKVPWKGEAVMLGDVRVTEDIITALSVELALVLGPDTSITPFKIAPMPIARKVRDFYKKIAKRTQRPKGKSISERAPVKRLLQRLEARYHSKTWWAATGAAAEGFVLGLSRSAKRNISVSLGWATTHVNPPSLAE